MIVPKLVETESMIDDRGGEFTFTSGTLFSSTKLEINVKNSLHGLNIFLQEAVFGVINGEVVCNLISVNPNTKTFGKSFSYSLTSFTGKHLIIPAGWAFGYRSLENGTRVLLLNNGYVKDIGLDPFDHKMNLFWGEDRPSRTNTIQSREELLFDTFNNFSEYYAEELFR